MENSFKKFYQDMRTFLPKVRIYRSQTFKNLTTIKIGGKIRAYIEVRSVSSLLKILQLCRKNMVEYFVIGNGSNLLPSDKKFNKVVLKLMLKSILVKDELVICGAGVNMFALNNFVTKQGLSGLEWSYGIPGTVGGAVKMNAGSFGGQMADVVHAVFYTDGDKIYKKSTKSLEFSYRHSFFSNTHYIILKVEILLKKSTPECVDRLCSATFDKRLASQPYGTYNAGSVFKKPPQNCAPVMIEMCGLKGVKYKNAQISTKHCGFILNTNGKATFCQVLKLINKIKKTVYEKFGIMLETEVEILN